MVDINLFALESLRQSYLNLSRTNLCILCRFQSNLCCLIVTSLCHRNQVVLRSNVHGNCAVRGIITSYGNIQIGFLYNGNGSILRNLAVRIQSNLVFLYKFSQSLRLVVWRNRSGVRQLGRSYAFADFSCSILLICSDCTYISLSITLLGTGLDFVFVLDFNGANGVLINFIIVVNDSQTSSTEITGEPLIEVTARNIGCALIICIVSIADHILCIGSGLEIAAADSQLTLCSSCAAVRRGEQHRFCRIIYRKSSITGNLRLMPVHNDKLRCIAEVTAGNVQIAAFIVLHGVDTARESTAVDIQLGFCTGRTAVTDHAGEMTFIINGNAIIDRQRAAIIVEDSIVAVAAAVILVLTGFLGARVSTAAQNHRTIVRDGSLGVRDIINYALARLINDLNFTVVGDGIVTDIGQLLAIQVKRNGLASRNNNIFCYVFQQLNGCAALCCCNSVSQRLITLIIDHCNNAGIKNSCAVNNQLTSGTRNKATIQVRLTRRSRLACLCYCITAFGSIVQSNFAYVDCTNNYANTPAAIIGRVQSATRHCIIGKGMVSCRICTSMTNNTANRTFCSNLSIFYRAICNGDISIDRTIIFFIIARSPANQTADTSTTSTGNRAVGQMAVIQFDFRHRINIVDECTDTLLISSILNRNIIQS